MAKRLAFLLIDANIIIEAFRLGVWEALVKNCDIYLAFLSRKPGPSPVVS